MDPRNQATDDLKNVIQTSGGGAGVALDGAQTATAMTGEVVTLTEAVERDMPRLPDTVQDAHGPADCKFISGINSILSEEAQPNDFTLDGLARWAKYYGLTEVVKDNLGVSKDAATRLRDHMAEHGPGDIVGGIDRAYPDYVNIVQMEGVNNGHVYVVNHSPTQGLDRRAEHRVHRLSVQAYHDSLGAMVPETSFMSGVGKDERGLRLTNLLLRSASARTVLGMPHPDMVYLEVAPSIELGRLAIVPQASPY